MTLTTMVLRILWTYNSYILIILLLSVLLYDIRKKRDILRKFDHFNTIPHLLIVGHVHIIMGKISASIEKALKILEKVETPAVFLIFNLPLIILGKPNDIRKAMNTSHDRGSFRRLVRDSLGDGILVNANDKWRRSRRIVINSLAPNRFEKYIVNFNKYSHSLISKILPLADTNTIFDLWPYVARMNIDVTYDNMVDHKVNSLDTEDDSYHQVIEETTGWDFFRFTQPLFYWDSIYHLFLTITGKQKIFREFKNSIRNLANRGKEKQIHFHGDASETENIRKNLLDMQLAAQQKYNAYTDEHLREDLANMIQAGYASTTRLICFTTLMLSMNQHLQDKLYQEIESIYGDTDRLVEMDDLNRLVYMDQCLKETLRRFTLIPISSRQYPGEIALNDKQKIPPNYNIIIALLALHNDPRTWKNPNTYNPDRFSEEETSKRDEYAFLPFGTGPHRCPGGKYSMISAKVQLIHLLRNFHFFTDMKMNDIKLDLSMALKTSTPFLVTARPRRSVVPTVLSKI